MRWSAVVATAAYFSTAYPIVASSADSAQVSLPHKPSVEYRIDVHPLGSMEQFFDTQAPNMDYKMVVWGKSGNAGNVKTFQTSRSEIPQDPLIDTVARQLRIGNTEYYHADQQEAQALNGNRPIRSDTIIVYPYKRVKDGNDTHFERLLREHASLQTYWTVDDLSAVLQDIDTQLSGKTVVLGMTPEQRTVDRFSSNRTVYKTYNDFADDVRRHGMVIAKDTFVNMDDLLRSMESITHLPIMAGPWWIGNRALPITEKDVMRNGEVQTPLCAFFPATPYSLLEKVMGSAFVTRYDANAKKLIVTTRNEVGHPLFEPAK